MNTTQPPASDEPAPKPGKIRTWWHPLLASLLRWQLGNQYQVEEEVPIGQKPLQIDILLLHKEKGELAGHARDMLAGLVERLGEFTLIEFKSPSDTLRAGDLQTFLAYALLYRAQNEPLLDRKRLHLLVIAPRLTQPYRDELKAIGLTAEVEEPGIWRLQDGAAVHPMWLLETETLAGLQHPLLTVVSPRFLTDRLGVYDVLNQVGYNDLMAYMAQQISQFRLSGKEFAMQHLGADREMHDTLLAIIKKMPLEDRIRFVDVDEFPVEERLKGVPAEERLKGVPAEERLKGVPAEERLKGVSAEERLKGVPAEERLKGVPAEERLKGVPAEELLKGVPAEKRLHGLTPEELDRLRKLLQQPRNVPADDDE